MNTTPPPKYIWDCGLTIDNIYEANNQALRVSKIDTAYVTEKGVILFGDNTIAANGGKHDASRAPFTESKSQLNHIKQSAAFHENVISVASEWQPCPWHFVIEILPGILLTKKFTKYADYKIHLGRTNSFVEQWLSIAGIDLSRIITGDIRCNNLFIPELAMYGTREKLHLELLKEHVAHLDGNYSTNSLLIYIKRTKKRTFSNSDEIQSCLQKYAADNNLVFYVHDDSCLPSVKEQLAIFKNARAVIAQHGAGSINMCVAGPNTLLIELFDKSYVNYCTKPIIQALGQSYVDIVCDGYSVAWKEIEKSLNEFFYSSAL